MSSFEELNARLAVFEQNVTRDFRGVASDVGDLKERIRRLEEGVAGGGAGGERKPKKSLIHVKMITPKELNSPGGWKRWKADVEDYCEEMFEGISPQVGRYGHVRILRDDGRRLVGQSGTAV